MASFNKVILLGNLTRDPSLKFLPSQMAVAEFGIACNRKYKDKEEVAFIDATAFGKTAEIINEHFHKGKSILLEGRLKYDSWEDKQGGGKRSKLTVVVESFQFVGGKAEADDMADNEPQRQASRPSMRDEIKSRRQPITEPPYSDEPPPDDCPF
jgi:single-strand DNA-binding protein